jgi:hypothetical protein
MLPITLYRLIYKIENTRRFVTMAYDPEATRVALLIMEV